MKKYHFGEKLQNRELNLVVRKTAIIVGQDVSNQDMFVKYYPDFKLSPGNLAGKVKFYVIDNILDR